MSDADTRPVIAEASPAAVIKRVRALPRQGASKPHSLSPEALAVAAKPQASPISPIVLAGAVRMVEFALIVVIGMLVYAAYLHQFGSLILLYGIATLSIAVLSMFAFQTADIYQVQAFRGHEKQYMRLAAAWSLVFLIVTGASFFAKAGDLFSRVWLGTFYVSGLVALMISRRLVFLAVRKWTQQGRLARRTVIVGGGEIGAHVIEELRRQKDTGVTIIGLFDDRGDDRTGSECAGERKLGTVDDLVAHRTAGESDIVLVVAIDAFQLDARTDEVVADHATRREAGLRGDAVVEDGGVEQPVQAAFRADVETRSGNLRLRNDRQRHQSGGRQQSLPHL